MLVLRHRLAVAGAVTAAAVAFPVAALAAAPPGTPAPPAASKSGAPVKTPFPVAKPPAGKAGAPSGKTSPPPELSSLARSAGISESRLEAGLAAAKEAGGNTAAGIAAFAAAARVPHATAQRVVAAVFGTQSPPRAAMPAQAAALAARLGVSRGAAERALDQLIGLGRGGIDPNSPAFAAIARELGVSPDRLAGALTTVKQSLAGKGTAGKGPGGKGPAGK